ncbi:uncharacterized protein [Lepeophtheirus salmonis]|uniref:uncharacterized protein n=1 Tax=Lepeophtheirus salmonis TaxID=72036 RepID=UPI001AEA339C|nr:uncharacterized protein LOC121130024 [Lepeophtheirus salmonis]
MVGEAWDTQDTKDLIQRIMKDITMRQLNLSLNKGIFEGKQKECKQIIKKIFEDLSSWASKTEHDILKQVDDVAERRRREMEEMSCSLICLPSQLAQHLDAVNRAGSCPTKLKRIQDSTRQIHKEAEKIFPNGSSDALVSVEFHLSSLAQSLFLDGNTDELFRINTCLKPEQLFITSACHTPEGQIHIDIGVSPNSPPIQSFILSEMSLSVLSSEQRLLVCVSLKTLYVQKHLVFADNYKTMMISLSGQNLDRGSFINISLISYSIKNSPALLRNSVWGNVGDANNNNCTRTGKPIDDLDESDLISMGYKQSDKSIFRNKSDVMKNKACRSLLENGITPKMTSSSEKSLIRLNPTPNVTPMIDGIDEIKNRRHLMDEEDEGMDSNSETLIDKGQHPLSSTIRCSQSPISKHIHIPEGGINSPFADRNAINLPLDQPSPLNIHTQKQKGAQHDDGNGSTGSNDATPCTSTQNNLSERLRSISFPKLDDEDEDEGRECSETRKKGLENLAKVQKLLTGEIPMSQGIEESKHDKSVSFHPNTTIMEPAPNRTRRVSITSNVNIMDLLPEDKETTTMCEDSSILLEDVTDRSSVEEQWQIRTGKTKTTDGELTLCKTIMQSQNVSNNCSTKSMSESGAWAYDRTLGGYTKSLQESNRYTKPGNVSFNESLWENSMNASDLINSRKPGLDLGSEKHNLVFVKKHQLQFLPQAITIDDKGFKYVSHPEDNKISVLRGNDRIDFFNHHLILRKPGYILAIPNERIVILDNRGIHMYSTDGNHLKTFLVDEAKNCRGLAYDFKYCHLLTMQKCESGSTLLVIDAEINFIIIKRIMIGYSTENPIRKEKTKCVFLAYWSNKVFVSDFGLGVVYVICLHNEQTEVFCKISEPKGLRVDPVCNVLVTSSEQGLIRVYNSTGNFVRSLKVPQMKNIVDLYLDNEKHNIFITDNKEHAVLQYRISSPKSDELTY